MKQVLILQIFSFLFFIPCSAQQSNRIFVDTKNNRKVVLLSDKDKAQIVTSILSEFDYLNRPFQVEDKEVIYVSREHIPSDFKPSSFRITFVLLNSHEIEEKVKTGFGYYAFEEFKVVGSMVLISFSRIYRDSGFQMRWVGGSGSPDSTNGIKYEFRKLSGKWYGRKVSGYASGS